MKQALQMLMPARCVKCGAGFDLQYDFASLEGEERAAVERFAKAARLAARTNLCWNCRG